MLNLVENAVNNLNRLVVEVALTLRFGKQNNAEITSFVAGAVLLGAFYDSADFKNTEVVRKISVFIGDSEQSGKHRVPENAVVGAFNVENLYVVLNLNAEFFIFFLVAPDV